MQRAGLRTSDGTDLTVGSISALDYLRRVGTAIVGVATTIASVLRETSGPTDLTLGAWSDGQYLKRVGATAVGAAVPTPNFGTATLDFGATFTDTISVTVTGQTWVTATSSIQAWVQDDSTADSSTSEHEYLAATIALTVVSRVVGTGFTINAFSEDGFCKGQFTVHWEGL